MTDEKAPSNRIVNWFKQFVRPIVQRTDPGPAIEELDKVAAQVDALEQTRGTLFPICLLGQAGVGKSTLINTLIADAGIVVPSGGGTGPLTANALRVVYGDKASFAVRYHSKQQVDQTRFILEGEIQRQGKAVAAAVEDSAPEDLGLDGLEHDSDEQVKTRTEEAISRACLLVAGGQTARRELTYLVDALRWVLGQKNRYGETLVDEDLERLRRVQEALHHSTRATARRFHVDEEPEFGKCLRDHACGFLAPMILEMTIHWPSPLLRDSLEIVDLPGIGILSDVHASITTDYLRNLAKAVMLVVDSRGIRREDAELLKTCGFLNRLLHASSDFSADPVALMAVVVKIDDVAVENWRNDKAMNGAALKSRAEHFSEVVERCTADISQRLEQFLRDVWEDDTEGKRLVIQSILENLQVYPVSAPQYRLLCSTELDDDKPFLPDQDATNIPALRYAISAVARRCVEEQNRRREDAERRFFGQLRARLEVLSAQRTEEQRAETEIAPFKQALGEFIGPLQREFDTRRGGFRNFLRESIPAQIEAKIESASNKARKAIQTDLGKLRDAHWKTLQAAVRKEGTFYGSRHINLPHDFALRFEEPVAEVWARDVLVSVRKETRDFADYQATAVTSVLDWARGQGMRVSTRLLEALVEGVKQHRQQVNAVGREAVDELRERVRNELIKRIEGPIRRRCKKFVEDNEHVGRGVKGRILELFAELAEEVVLAASKPASALLVERFQEVDKEILAAFREHSDPLQEAANALVQRREQRVRKEDSQVLAAIEAARAALPATEEVVA
ncbi:MAG: dynamin family protein [Gammaproteobacteria bacterium]